MNAHPPSGLARLLDAALRKAGVRQVRSSTLARLSTADERLDALAARLGGDTIGNLIRYAMQAHWRVVDLIFRPRKMLAPHDVLERLFDPAGTTARLAGLLTPGGRIVHASACFESCYAYSHHHVFFFAGRSADVLARRAGMTIEGWVRDGNPIACTLRADASASP